MFKKEKRDAEQEGKTKYEMFAWHDCHRHQWRGFVLLVCLALLKHSVSMWIWNKKIHMNAWCQGGKWQLNLSATMITQSCCIIGTHEGSMHCAEQIDSKLTSKLTFVIKKVACHILMWPMSFCVLRQCPHTFCHLLSSDVPVSHNSCCWGIGTGCDPRLPTWLLVFSQRKMSRNLSAPKNKLWWLCQVPQCLLKTQFATFFDEFCHQVSSLTTFQSFTSSHEQCVSNCLWIPTFFLSQSKQMSHQFQGTS